MADTVSVDSVAQDQLRAFIERIERMEEEKKAIADDIKEIYAEAKGNGFDTKVVKKIVAIRKMDHAERMEQEALLALYMDALGMQSSLPFDDDDEPPRGGRRQPEHRAEAGGLRPIAAVTSAIVANLQPSEDTQPGNPAGSATTVHAKTPDTPVVATHSAAVSNSADAPIPSGAAGEVGPASSAPIPPQPSEAGLPVATAAGANPVANVGEEANGGIAAASVDPASRDVDDAERQQLAASGFTGEATGGVLERVPSAPTNSPSGDAAEGMGGVTHPPLVPARRQWQHSDPPHPMCKRPDGPRGCGGYSNLALCAECRDAAGGQIAHGDSEHRESVH